jgi:hypothetical protein
VLVVCSWALTWEARPKSAKSAMITPLFISDIFGFVCANIRKKVVA